MVRLRSSVETAPRRKNGRSSVKESELVASRVHVFDHMDVAVNLNVRWACVPFSFHGLGRRYHLLKFGSHVLLLRDSMHASVIEKNLQALLIDSDGASDLCGFDVDLARDIGDEFFEGAVHEINGSEVIVVGLFTRDAWLHEETRHLTL